MDEKKQIDTLHELISKYHEAWKHGEGDWKRGLAECIVDAGYRKQSEWISVANRLPDEETRVLVYINSERSYTKIDTDRLKEGKWVRWYKDVTHWMPLPEPPRMKGGAG